MKSPLYIKLYRGYANKEKAVVFGHLLQGETEKMNYFDRNWWRHALSVIKLFFVQNVKERKKVEVTFRENTYHTLTDKNGFFECEIPFNNPPKPGWHRYKARSRNGTQSSGVFLMPCETSVGIISDIDDTYLISHSRNTLRKLQVMLFKNIYKRKAFEDVVRHYNYLSTIGSNKNHVFFNVSSSEWNLYDLIIQFSKVNELPNSVLLLDKLKSGLKELLFSGQGDHSHKTNKIKSTLDFYNDRKFILIGDDSQQDPYIYKEIPQLFPDKILAIYIRQTGNKPLLKVKETLNELEKQDIICHYFKESENALHHSQEILTKKINTMNQT